MSDQEAEEIKAMMAMFMLVSGVAAFTMPAYDFSSGVKILAMLYAFGTIPFSLVLIITGFFAGDTQ